MVLLLIIVFLFSILTLSKASYIALFCCGIFAIKPFNYKYSKIVEIIIFLLFIFVFIFFFQQISDTHIFSRTLNMLTETDSSLEVRGYKVFLNATSLQTLFGMGVKNVISINYYDIHSTYAYIFSSFGLIGLLIFFTLIIFFGL